MCYQINEKNKYYPRLLLCENDEDSAIHAVDSDHLGYRKIFSGFKTSSVSLAISFIPRGMIVLFLHKRTAASLVDNIRKPSFISHP